MKPPIKINGHCIGVCFDAGIVHIINDAALQSLLQQDAETHADLLAEAITTAYRACYREELAISHDSLVVEIWGHVYAGRLADALARLLPVNLLEQLAEKVSGYCAVIDCGEAGKDTNRFFWDLLAPFKRPMAKLLPSGKSTPVK